MFRPGLTSFSLLVLVLTFLCGCTDKSNNGIVPVVPPATSIQFKEVQTFLEKPSQVQFTFRATDNQGHAILLDPTKLPGPFRIFESGQEIDYSETSYFVHPAASLELDMVLLLDFTNSMATWKENGKSAIDLEIGWAGEVIDQLSATHRMAIMEYHDRNVEAGVIAPFSSDKSYLHAALAAFVSQHVDNGSSRVWDALFSAVSLFDGNPDDNKHRTILCITDGKETSSSKTPADIINIARLWHAGVFLIGTGNVANEQTLTGITSQTGGEYYPATDIAAFEIKLQQIKQDLGGQYKLSYISLRRSGNYDVKVQLNYNGLSGYFDTTLDLGSVYGDDRIGVLTFDQPTLAAGQLDVIVRAQHVPRNIDHFRFKIDTSKNFSVSVIAASEGGLCGGWNVAKGADGYIDITSPTPLQFGDFGPMFKIVIDQVVESSLDLPFTLDTTIYTGGKSFTYPHDITFGN